MIVFQSNFFFNLWILWNLLMIPNLCSICMYSKLKCIQYFSFFILIILKYFSMTINDDY